MQSLMMLKGMTVDKLDSYRMTVELLSIEYNFYIKKKSKT